MNIGGPAEMSEADEIAKLKRLPPLQQVGCGTCLFYKKDSWSMLSRCNATGRLAHHAWQYQCKGGTLWQPNPLPVPILVRFKRWLIG